MGWTKSELYVARSVPAAETFHIITVVRSFRIGTTASGLTASGFTMVTVDVSVGEGVGVVVPSAIFVADPTTQIFPDASRAAAVAISVEPLSRTKVHFGTPLPSVARRKPSVPLLEFAVPNKYMNFPFTNIPETGFAAGMVAIRVIILTGMFLVADCATAGKTSAANNGISRK
jgi:hypothetical protein